MSENRRHKPPREKDLTGRFFSGEFEEDNIQSHQHFTARNKNAQQNKIERTALLRLAEQPVENLDALPVGQVVQVFSLFYQVEHTSGPRLCVMRKTLSKLSDTGIVTGDWVNFRDTGVVDESGRPAAVIERVLPRKTVLTRSDSFLAHVQHPIVANADQVLIVASLVMPTVKWGLIDRMIVAAQSGGLTSIVCLNKIDLADTNDESRRQMALAQEALAHYQKLGITSLQVSASEAVQVQLVADVLQNKTTVLAGHSGVGKSTLIAAVQKGLDIRIGEISAYTDKGRHTTTSARRYKLDFGGYVIDTPGVKMFGLWGITKDNLRDFYPDVADDSAPDWRKESYQRILDSLRTGANSPQDYPSRP